jgi:Rab3 GTPase-activating protein catalytic subunit
LFVFAIEQRRFTCNIRILAISLLWQEFVKEIRWHWENQRTIAHIEIPTESIDFRRCLIQQKLQMIAYTISKKQRAVKLSSSTIAKKDGWEIEVFVDEESDALGLHGHSVSALGRKQLLSPPLKLIRELLDESSNSSLDPSKNPDGWIYVPETQTFSVITSDVLEQQQRNLESNQDFSQFHSQLKSDMEAFKAANPGCVMADFVRWYSPTDWIVENSPDALREHATSENPDLLNQDSSQELDRDVYSGLGRLSVRMRAESNVWRTIWACAQPIPVSEQKPLFDYDSEGEKAIHYLETISPLDLMQQ